jgi:hypothetical protein
MAAWSLAFRMSRHRSSERVTLTRKLGGASGSFFKICGPELPPPYLSCSDWVLWKEFLRNS